MAGIEEKVGMTRKQRETAAKIPMLLFYREDVFAVLTIGVSFAIAQLLRRVTKGLVVDEDFEDLFRKGVLIYDWVATVFIFLAEMYTLAYFHPNVFFCFPAFVCPKCHCTEWYKAVWYALFMGPNFIWARGNQKSKLVMLGFGVCAVLYFICGLIDHIYIENKLREYDEARKLAGLTDDDETPEP